MATDTLPEVRRSQYTAEEITQGLTAVALSGGNFDQAHERLKAAGIDIPADTLGRWRRERHPERYREISNDLAPKIEAQVIDLQRELATRATTAALLAVDLEHERITEGKVRDAASSARNLSTVAGIAVDKVLSLTGRPTQVTEVRNVDTTLKHLERMGLVEGTAEEISEAETVESTQLPQGATAASS